MAAEPEPAVKSVKTNFDIIHAVLETDGARITELADRLDMPLSTLHDHLGTLKQLDYVVQRGQRYHVGIRFLNIGGQARNTYKVYRVGKPVIDQLARTTGDHANMLIEEHGIGALVYKAVGEEAIQLDTYTGMRMHLHTTAMGKALLAHMSREQVEDIVEERGLPAVTEHTITDLDSLVEQLQETRERGYARDFEERIDGVSCVAAPILGTDGEPIAAVSVSGPTQKIRGGNEFESLIDSVQRAANVIEVNLTFS